MEFLKTNQIKIEPPTKTLKLTGTRLGAILGVNKWSTPFKVWCEVTKTYKEPFEDTIYTLAGKVIEPKQADYMEKSYFMRDIVRPADIYGEDVFEKTYGDFFPKEKVLGGMWDYILKDNTGKPTTVLEMKTTKRSEDWQDDIPEYYALQASLYAWLLGVDNVIMVASFLADADYKNPEKFVPSAKNTITVPFKVSERYPDFEHTHIKPALEWWNEYVVKGISPVWDEKQDADILKAIRTTNINTTTADWVQLIAEAEELKKEIDTLRKALDEKLKEKETRLKAITDALKTMCIEKMGNDTNRATLMGNTYQWIVTKCEKLEIDESALKADGLLEKYKTKSTVSYRLTSGEIKGE